MNSQYGICTPVKQVLIKVFIVQDRYLETVPLLYLKFQILFQTS